MTAAGSVSSLYNLKLTSLSHHYISLHVSRLYRVDLVTSSMGPNFNNLVAPLKSILLQHEVVNATT